MISSDRKKIFDNDGGMLYEMKKEYLRTPHMYPELYRRAREWVYQQHYTEVRFGTTGGTTINGNYYPSEIWFGTHCPDLELLFKLKFAEIAPL